MAYQQPKIDYSTFQGKLKILKDVKDAKYPLPKNFPTYEELVAKNTKL